MIFNEIKCHVKTSLGLVGGMHPLHPPLCPRLVMEHTDAQFYGSFYLCKVKTSLVKNFAQFCQVRCQCWQKEAPCWNFVFVSRSGTTHVASFLFFDRGLIQCGPKSENLTPSSRCCISRQPPCLHAHCNCRCIVIIVVWSIVRQADRNGETVKHFHNCIEVLSQFRVSYCTNLRQGSKWLKRWTWQCTDTKLIIIASNFWARKSFRPKSWQPSVAIVTFRKTCFPQIILLQYKAKPYLGFQNLGCHCKILGCHFDTQKRLKNTGIFCVWLCVFYVHMS